MRKELIVKNSTIPTDNLPLKFIVTDVTLCPITIGEAWGKSISTNHHFATNITTAGSNSSLIIPAYKDIDQDGNPDYLYNCESGKNVFIHTNYNEESEVELGYIIHHNKDLGLSQVSDNMESNYVQLNQITTQLNSTYTIPSEHNVLYVGTVVAPKYNFIHFKSDVKSEEDAIKGTFKVERGRKLSGSFEDKVLDSKDGIDPVCNYSVTFGGYMIVDNQTERPYSYIAENSLDAGNIISDIRFDEYYGYKHIRVIYDDLAVTHHPKLYLTPYEDSTPLYFHLVGSKNENSPYYTFFLHASGMHQFELGSSDSNSDLLSKDISIYVGDSFTRALKIPFYKNGNIFSMEPNIPKSLYSKSKQLNLYLVINENGLKQVYTIDNNSVFIINIRQ